MMVYRIKDWDRHFENNRTRELKRMDWVPVPNKHDGDGFTELLDHKNGMAHYGAWHLILQVASKCDPRGTLLRDGAAGGKIPHTAESIARITRGVATTIKDAIDRLVSIGWVESCDDPALDRHNPAPSCGSMTMEWKGMEEKGMELNIAVPTDPSLIGKPRGELKLVLLSDHEIGKLLTKYTADQLRDAIAILESYLANKPKKKYDSHYAVMKKGGWIYDKVVVCQPKKPVENKI